MIDFIVKLGGSAMTEKAKLETIKSTSLARAADVLAQCYQNDLKFVVIHGAGSYGHHQAKQYSVRGGYASSNSDQASAKLGFSLTHISVTKLHFLSEELEQLIANQKIIISFFQEFVSYSLQHGFVPSDKAQRFYPCDPCVSWTTCDGKVTRDASDQVKHCLQQGLVPVLHGDCVFDDLLGCTILSGDTILEVLCEKLKPRRAVFLMDCAGIFNIPPHLPGSVVIPEILVSQDGGMLTRVTARDGTSTVNTCDVGGVSSHVISECGARDVPDVTGGLQLKLKTALHITSNHQGGITVIACSLDDDVFRDVCVYNKIGGTVFKYHELSGIK